ncbi:MFS-type transporter SLC18B1-like [Oculina patagonica]
MNMERKDLIPSNDSIESDSFSGIHMEKAQTNVSGHELGSAFSAGEATTQSFSWSFRKVVILASLCLVTALSDGALSMIVPFFPQQAEVRGVSTAVVGLIFGSYPFMAFMFAPICGLLISKKGPNRVLFFGMFASGTSLTLFGFCAWISNTTEFAVLSFLLRTLTAFGEAASETAVMSIVIEEFPDRLGMALGLIETFVGVGLSLGPVLGGGLYTVGGFQLPFFVIGCSMIAAIPFLFSALSSKCASQTGKTPDEEKASFPIIEALKIPSVLMLAVCFTTSGLTQGYVDPILGPHLERMMNLNSTQIGLVFLVDAAMYALTTPLAGWIGDKTQCHRWLTVSGCIGFGFGSFLLGPAPFLTFFLASRRVWFVCLSMAIMGFSEGIFFVQLMPDLVKITRDNGMPDTSATRGFISGIFSGMSYLGATIGPTLAGIVDEHIGFQWAMVATVLVVFTLLEGTEAGRWKTPYSSIPDSSDEEEFEELVLDSAHEKETG